jgi:uncharacterized protein
MILPAVAQPHDRVRRALMLQSWRQLTFIHWRYPVEVVQRCVPAPLKVETFDGAAWVAVTPFILQGLRPPMLPSIPWISEFPETNCRTYVRGPDGHSGVWFFSLDAARVAAVAGARMGYGLPYAWSRMRVVQSSRQMTYQSRRIFPGSARTHIVVEPGEPVTSQALELFLTARFRLYSVRLGHLTYTSVEHAPWPLCKARLIQVEQTLTACAGLPDPSGPPIAHFSPAIQVRIGPPKLVTLLNS